MGHLAGGASEGVQFRSLKTVALSTFTPFLFCFVRDTTVRPPSALRLPPLQWQHSVTVRTPLCQSVPSFSTSLILLPQSDATRSDATSLKDVARSLSLTAQIPPSASAFLSSPVSSGFSFFVGRPLVSPPSHRCTFVFDWCLKTDWPRRTPAAHTRNPTYSHIHYRISLALLHNTAALSFVLAG